MDVLLVLIVAISLLAAVVMGVVTWRVVREDRARSDARVAALAAEIDGDTGDEPVWNREAFGSGLEEFSQGRSDTVAVPGGLFASPEPERAGFSRIVPAIAAGVVLVGGVLLATLLLGGGGGKPASAEAAGQPQPIELLSLRHDIKPGTLGVTGLVRNPKPNPALGRTAAIVFLFDRKGGFLASGRGPLDFTTLGPGEESPFMVSVNAPPGVARYRVSFRKEDGGVIPHVDRREGMQP